MADTPSCALFAGLKLLGRINNSQAAQLLLLQDIPYGGKPISDRLAVPSFLSREIVHAKPGELPASLFAPFDQSARRILDLILQNKGSDARTLNQISKRYMETCVPAMQESLAQYGIDSMLFRNGVERIETSRRDDTEERLYLHLVFYIATGCLGSPAHAIELTESCVSKQMLATLGTVETTVGSFFSASARPTGDVRLGLLRVIGNSARPPLRALSLEPQGTVIGSLTGSQNAITDVDSDVSREHLRIWMQDGHWLTRGLDSTNGSKLIGGLDHAEHVIEPPRWARADGAAGTTVEIHNGDTLCLGATTRFLVIRITD